MGHPLRHREDFAWLAGFWDGEGCVSSLNTTYAKNYPVFSLTQAGGEGEALCRRVARIAGVRASVSGPFNPRSGDRGRQPQWKVRISGHERVQYLLAACWPWLSRTKQEQATRVLLGYREIRPVKAARTHCPKCASPWAEPHIVYNRASRGWRRRVCRRKDPANARPKGQHPRPNARHGSVPLELPAMR